MLGGPKDNQVQNIYLGEGMTIEKRSSNIFRVCVTDPCECIHVCKLSINIVFNYSKIVLTSNMINVLNCSLNFGILPIKIVITQTLVEDLNDP